MDKEIIGVLVSNPTTMQQQMGGFQVSIMEASNKLSDQEKTLQEGWKALNTFVFQPPLDPHTIEEDLNIPTDPKASISFLEVEYVEPILLPIFYPFYARAHSSGVA